MRRAVFAAAWLLCDIALAWDSADNTNSGTRTCPTTTAGTLQEIVVTNTHTGTVDVSGTQTAYASITERKLRCKCTSTAVTNSVTHPNCAATVNGVSLVNIYNLFDFKLTTASVSGASEGQATQLKQQELYDAYVQWRNDIQNGVVQERERERMRLLGEGFKVGKVSRAQGRAKKSSRQKLGEGASVGQLKTWTKPSGATAIRWDSNDGSGLTDLKYSPTHVSGFTADAENKKWCIDLGFMPDRDASVDGNVGLRRHLVCNIMNAKGLSTGDMQIELWPCTFADDAGVQDFNADPPELSPDAFGFEWGTGTSSADAMCLFGKVVHNNNALYVYIALMILKQTVTVGSNTHYVVSAKSAIGPTDGATTLSLTNGNTLTMEELGQYLSESLKAFRFWYGKALRDSGDDIVANAQYWCSGTQGENMDEGSPSRDLTTCASGAPTPPATTPSPTTAAPTTAAPTAPPCQDIDNKAECGQYSDSCQWSYVKGQCQDF